METMVLAVSIVAVIFIVIKLRETFRRNNKCKIIICENYKLLHHIIPLFKRIVTSKRGEKKRNVQEEEEIIVKYSSKRCL